MKNEVYYIWNVLIKFIINKGILLCLSQKFWLTCNDSRKKPKKLQEEGSKEEGVSIHRPVLHSATNDFYSVHAFAKKEWYNVHVPTVFDTRVPTITPCNRTAGQSKYTAQNLSCSFIESSIPLPYSNPYQTMY